MTGLKQAVNDTQGRFCTSCYTGVYPTDLVQLEVREGSVKNGSALESKANESDQIERPVAVEHEG
jgi:hypothetical protein